MVLAVENLPLVFEACRPVFTGTLAPPQKLETIRSTLEVHQSSFVNFFPAAKNEAGRWMNSFSKFSLTVEMLSKNHLFEDQDKAKSMFPSAFKNDTGASTGGFTAINSGTAAAATSGAALTSGRSNRTTSNSADDGVITRSKKRKLDQQQSEEQQTPHQELDQEPVTPFKLLYATQHRILTMVQAKLEYSFYQYAIKYLPASVQFKGREYPDAGELTEWVKIMRRNVALTPLASSNVFNMTAEDPTLRDMKRLRNVAVHRTPVTATEVLKLLRSARALTAALIDSETENLLVQLIDKLDDLAKRGTAFTQQNEANLKKELGQIEQEKARLQERETVARKTAMDGINAYRADAGKKMDAAIGEMLSNLESRAGVQGEVKADEENMSGDDGNAEHNL